jgi:hypothetical protein
MVANTIMVLHRAGALTGSLTVDGFLGARVQAGPRLSRIERVQHTFSCRYSNFRAASPS